MLAIILLCVYAGLKLDGWIDWRIPVFTMVLSVLGVVVSIYFVTRDLLRKK
ncbi:MAG: AtpZ/AtpI family protein [Bacteroidales bacterium]